VKIKYQDWKPGAQARHIIRLAEDIAASYQQQGYDLTLRQLYYQFVARGHIPNSQAEYNRLGTVINKARMAGLFDWDYITDRTRNLKSLAHWDDPAHAIYSIADQYRNRLWDRQPNRVEVWVEKEALAGVIGQVAERHDVAYFACRGYVSASELWGAAQRLGGYMRKGQDVTVLHLGDHDPSGIDMTRDIEDRLRLIINHDNVVAAVAQARRSPAAALVQDNEDLWRAEITGQAHDIGRGYGTLDINRIALNMDQVEEYDPPPNPAKLTDSRVDGYIAAYGESSWELDALDPAVLDALIEDHIEALKDQDLWEQALAEQEAGREAMTACSQNWTDVAEYAMGL
jgi:hypothetical protein